MPLLDLAYIVQIKISYDLSLLKKNLSSYKLNISVSRLLLKKTSAFKFLFRSTNEYAIEKT